MASKWEPHKETIEKLFSDRKRTLEEVMAIMKRDAGFTASKTEYERQLRKWKIQKNWKASHVKFLKSRLTKRQQQSQESQVYMNKVLVPQLEIQKRTARCFVPVTEQYALERCGTPEGLTIITPISNSYMTSVRTRDLPWIYFQRQLQSIGGLDRLISMPGQMLRVMLPAVCPTASSLVSEHLGQIFRHLCATMPVERDEDIYTLLGNIVGGNYNRATTEILKLTLYFLSNNLFGYDEHGNDLASLVCDKLFRWFQMGNNYVLLKAILSHKLPTIEAFAENIFSSALEAEDRAMARIFLESGLSPDTIIGDRTALQFVAGRGNVGLAELLLDFGADINTVTTGDPDVWSFDMRGRTPLEIAAEVGEVEVARFLVSKGAGVNMPGKDRSSALQNSIMARSPEITSLLIHEGADINASFGAYGCPLECAIRTGAHDLVEVLLERGANINCPGGVDSNTPLQSAVMMEDDAMVKYLLQLGADVNSPAREEGGRTALQYAAENGDFELCQVLLQAGADVNSAPSTTNLEAAPVTALAAAVSSKEYQVVDLLLKHGADVNDRRGGSTALEIATRLNDVEMVHFLLLAKADASRDSSIIVAAEAKNSELILTLLEAGGNINKVWCDGRNALTTAVQTNDVNFVQFLLSKGADPNPRPATPNDDCCGVPLVVATNLENFRMVDMLVKAGADWDRTGGGQSNALQAAARTGNTELVRYLVNAGACLNWPAQGYMGLTALQAAVESGNTELIQFLISEGADLNSPAAEIHSVTALQAAVSKRDTRLVRILLAAGAHANDAPSAYCGSTSLQRAARNGDDDLIELLLDHGADINWPAADTYGRTALQVAAEWGHYQTVQLLLANGENVNAPASNGGGHTALQAAAMGGYLRIAKILLDAGACVDATTPGFRCRTALEAAAEYGRIDMLKLLLNAGAKITGDGCSQLNRALNLATEMGHDAAAKFLKYHQIC